MRKVSVLSLLLILVILTAGCSDPWFKADIISTVDEYSPAMSDIPGMPIKIVFDVDGPMPSITQITYITDNGSFLQIENGTTIVNLGKTADLKGRTIYWTPLEENKDMADKAKITIIVSYRDKVVEVGKTFRARIKKNVDGLYIIR